MPRFEFEPNTDSPHFYKFGVRGTLRQVSSAALANTLALSTTAGNVTADTYLFGPTHGDFESVTPNIKNLQTGQAIPAKWPTANPPVGNQACCSDCWAFSNAKTAYARYCVQTGHTNAISTEMMSADRVVTCASVNSQCQGCNGGNPYYAWQTMSTSGYNLSSSPYNPQGPAKMVNGQCKSSIPSMPCGSQCGQPPFACQTSDPLIYCYPVHSSSDPVEAFAIVPEFNSMSLPSPPQPNMQDPTNLTYDVADLPFYASCIQRELIGGVNNGQTYGGPVVVTMTLPCESQLLGYKSSDGMFMFTPAQLGEKCTVGGHAIMLTGWQWVDGTYLKTLPTAIKNQYVDTKNNKLLDDSTKTVHQLVWNIQNQWDTTWGNNGSFPCAASFFMVTDSTGNVSFYPLAVQKETYLELNCSAANFYKPAPGQPSLYQMMFMDRVSRRLKDTRNKLYNWKQEAYRYFLDYALPSIMMERQSMKVSLPKTISAPAIDASSAEYGSAGYGSAEYGSAEYGSALMGNPYAMRPLPKKQYIINNPALFSQETHSAMPVDPRMTTEIYGESTGLTNFLNQYTSNYEREAPLATIRMAMIRGATPNVQAHTYKNAMYE